MKNITISVLALTLIFASLSAYADNSKHSHETEEMGGAKQMQSESMGASVQQMKQMREHMMSSEDPVERKKIMREHMQMMHKGMDMMGMMGGSNGAMGSNGQIKDGNMDGRMEMMERKMMMMQEMMRGMMTQLEAQEKQSK